MINRGAVRVPATIMVTLLVVTLLGTSSCTPEIDLSNQALLDKTSSESIPKMFKGEYAVLYKEHISSDGKVQRFSPLGGADTSMVVHGQMSEMILTFTNDSLGISQLMNQGWIEGSVSLKWENEIPKRVGCRWVESANEGQLSWYQNDIIIRHYLEKL